LGAYVLGAMVVTGIIALLSERALISGGWRIPFLIAGSLGIIGLCVRTWLEESPAYERQTETRGQEQRRLSEHFHSTMIEPWRRMLICVGLVLAYNVTNYMLTQYMPTYLSATLGLPKTPALLVGLAVMVVLMVLITFAARLSGRVGRKPLMTAGCISLVVLLVPAFLLIEPGSYTMIFPGVLFIGFMLLCLSSTMPSALPALFPADIHNGSLAVAFNITVTVFGGTTPLIAEVLVTATGSDLVPAFLLMAAGVIGGIAVFFARKSARQPLPDESPMAASETEAQQIVEASGRE
jgi:MHS family proline/betaine transporter-like MFS transporter